MASSNGSVQSSAAAGGDEEHDSLPLSSSSSAAAFLAIPDSSPFDGESFFDPFGVESLLEAYPPPLTQLHPPAIAAANSSTLNETGPPRSKKRPRASRRAPTTVLTTDTSNFRQMVQEFTGIPAQPFSGFSRPRIDLFGSARSAAPLLRPYPQKLPFSTAIPPFSVPTPPLFEFVRPSDPDLSTLFPSDSSAPAAEPDAKPFTLGGGDIDSWLCSPD